MEGTAPVTRQKSKTGRGSGSSRNRKEMLPPVAWIFRTNIPLRRGMPLPKDVQRRNFFGIGEVLSVLANVSKLSLVLHLESTNQLHEVSQVKR